MSSNMENVLPMYGFAAKPKGDGGSVTSEQIQQAVDNYLSENPVQAGSLVVKDHIISLTGGTENSET